MGISRIELVPYTHAASKFLGIQMDAAINSGNSGGPALQDGRVIGIAFQNMPTAENIGFIIPTLIIDHFLQDISRSEKYVGFCSLGLVYQTLPDTLAMQRFLGMRKEDLKHGVLVT